MAYLSDLNDIAAHCQIRGTELRNVAWAGHRDELEFVYQIPESTELLYITVDGEYIAACRGDYGMLGKMVDLEVSSCREEIRNNHREEDLW